jgi:sialic acid synthase SpsE
MTSMLKIGGKFVGDSHPVMFVAETGAFFGKDVGMALEYLNMSCEAGVDAFKTEILHDPDVVYKSSGLNLRYSTSKNTIDEDYRSFIERKTLPLSDYSSIFNQANNLNMPLIATVFDNIGVDFLKEHKASAIKISNNNMHNKPLIEYAASTKIPLIIDLGNIPLWMAERALNWVKSVDGNVMFNYHPGKNPASASIHNLRVINHLKDILGTPIGLSCHYQGDEILYAGIGAGINLIEKGVDFDPDRNEADLVSAASFDDLSKIVTKCKNCSLAMGENELFINEGLLDNVRTSLTASTIIKEGDVISKNNIMYSWPPLGASPSDWDLINGRQVLTTINKGDPIRLNDINFNNNKSDEG